MMAAIALIALAMAIVDQYARRQQALVRQEQLRAEAAFERAQAALASIGRGPHSSDGRCLPRLSRKLRSRWDAWIIKERMRFKSRHGVFQVSDDRGPWAAPGVPLAGDIAENSSGNERAGCGGWIVLVFSASAWLGSAVVFVLYGFNPGGSPLKEAKWRGALLVWPTVMALLLGYSIYYWRDRRRFWGWVMTLVLMATCPMWFPVLYGLMVELARRLG
jgi:hypothetical protein